MNALYFCQEWSGLLLTALASFATVMQMGATLLVLEQRPLTSQRVARDILEGACFAQLFVLAWVIAQFQGSMGGGFVPDNRWDFWACVYYGADMRRMFSNALCRTADDYGLAYYSAGRSPIWKDVSHCVGDSATFLAGAGHRIVCAAAA